MMDAAKLSPEEREEKRIHWLADMCGVPKKYWHASRSTWKDAWRGRPSPWPTPLDDWRGEGDHAILALNGKPGHGKTHAAVAVLSMWARYPELYAKLSTNRWTGLPDRVIMIRIPHAVRTLQKHYRKVDQGGVMIRGMAAPDFFAHVADTFDLVLYDDWGSQPDRENWWMQVEGWIDDRHAEEMPTIVTINPRGIGKPDARIARRVTDGMVIEMPWSGS